VLIADDDALTRAALRTIIDAHDDIELVGEASDGLEAIERAAELHPLKAGATGFLRKDAPPERLLAFIRSTGAGDALLDPTITRRLVERYSPTSARQAQSARLAELTAREVEVLREVARGQSNAEIAAQMYLSEATGTQSARR